MPVATKFTIVAVCADIPEKSGSVLVFEVDIVRSRLGSLCVLATAVWCSGCVLPWTASHLDTPAPGGRAIVIRGLCGYFPGAVHLADRLDDAGLETSVIFCKEAPGVACALSSIQGACDEGPLMIVGYSLGANEAIRLCRALGDDGIVVDSLILIECPYRDTIPPNVAKCVNIYRSRPRKDWIPMFRGLPLRNECGTTAMRNVDVRRNCLRHVPLTHSHFTICGAPEIHDLVLEEVAGGLDEYESELEAAALQEEGFEGEWLPGEGGEWIMEEGVPADGWQPALGEPCCQ